MTAPLPISAPSGSDVLTYLGWPSNADLAAQADQHVQLVVALASNYTRQRGINVVTGQCDWAVRAVVLAASARSLSNPSQSRRIEAGSYSELPASFAGWTLVERVVLDGYRRTAG